MSKPTCAVAECRAYPFFRRLCNTHHAARGLPKPTEMERVLDKVRVHEETGCWEWQGRLASNNYGQIQTGQKTRQVHRVTYEATKGPIPEGLFLDHLCRNRICCNPEHLEAVTARENWRRGLSPSARANAAGVCYRGHPLSGDNLYVNPQGVRRCRKCSNEFSLASYRAKAAARVAAGESRGPYKLRTHCPAGHPYSGSNLRVDKRGGRICRACMREHVRRHRQKVKAARAAA